MLARVTCFALDGLLPRRVTVEVDLRTGLPALTIVGRADAAVRESRERVHSALLNSGFQFPQRRITVNLAPAQLRKQGPGFDLATACGILAASDQVPAERLAGWAVFGELSLGGELRPCGGALAAAEGARAAGLRRDRRPVGVRGRSRTGRRTAGRRGPHARRCRRTPARRPATGTAAARARDRWRHANTSSTCRMFAATPVRSVRWRSPPRVGTTSCCPARRAPGRRCSRAGCRRSSRRSILRRPSRSRGSTRSPACGSGAASSSGRRSGRRTTRSPRPASSAAAPVRLPGEATLAHHGVLFLDELSEFSRPALEALRQPLEDGCVTIVRGQTASCFPTRVMLAAATNPCPCGESGSACRCTSADLARHRRRLSGPLLDRLDLLVAVHRPTSAELAAPPVTDSATVRERVAAARRRQRARSGGLNSTVTAAELAGALRPGAQALLREVYDRGTLSARGHDAGAARRAHGRRSRGCRGDHRRVRPRGTRTAAGAGRPRAGGGMTACDDCLRRAWLMAAMLSESSRAGAASRAGCSLSRTPQLIEALAARSGRPGRRHAAFDRAARAGGLQAAGLTSRCVSRLGVSAAPGRSGGPAGRAVRRWARRGIRRPGSRGRRRTGRRDRRRAPVRGGGRGGRSRARAGPRRRRRLRRQRTRVGHRQRRASRRARGTARPQPVRPAAPTVAVLAGGADVIYPPVGTRAVPADPARRVRHQRAAARRRSRGSGRSRRATGSSPPSRA